MTATSNGIMNDWRNGNGIPVYQHFSAPSTTFVNIFRQPGVYNITIALPGSVGRMNPTITAPPSGIPSRQPGMTLGSHNQPNFGGAPSMTRPKLSPRRSNSADHMPGTPVQGTDLPSQLEFGLPKCHGC
ncbi:hypothetical protein Ocin01_17289 [Orchesella cincta]|uniref:Uncharacterized protein n=1 Tax=Orchesella cincta TaxID=48709 RepID=A0A1D2M913_ORCCI|nr:hypothetical protein Ocin01_17289 [Orchesella cincta]